MADPPRCVLWTGGFDSTAHVLALLRQGIVVQPIYMRHSPGWEKCPRETDARVKIREAIGSSQLLAEETWDAGQLIAVPVHGPVLAALTGWANAINISHQYTYLRFCRDVLRSGLTAERTVDLCVVQWDELMRWVTEPRVSASVREFFTGFAFPVVDQSKAALWEQAPARDREVLRLTFSCEESGSKHLTCIEREVPVSSRCPPCKRRLAVLGS